MSHAKIYLICDGNKGGIHMLGQFQPHLIGPPNGMLEPDGTFVGVVHPNDPAAREMLDEVDGITVLPSHLTRGKLQAKHKSRLDSIGDGKHGIQANDDGYTVASKLHGHYKSLAAAGSRCCAVLHPDV